MSDYLALIITAVLIAGALAWWLISLNSVSKSDALPKNEAPPKAVPAPPVLVTPPPAETKTDGKEKAAPAPLMADPKPASRTAPPKAQAPLKAGATKAAPTKTAKPANQKATAPQTAAAQPGTIKQATAKVPAPKVTIKTAALKAAPTPKAAPNVVVPDNLGLLKGVGPKLTALLQSLGVTSFQQVANWSAADITEVDAKLGNFAGRITRDNWVDQAKLLSSGDFAGFEKKYGALGGQIKS